MPFTMISLKWRLLLFFTRFYKTTSFFYLGYSLFPLWVREKDICNMW